MILDLITREELEPFLQTIADLQKRVAHLEAMQDEWVSVKEAMKRTGIRCRKTLLQKTQGPDAILLSKIEGKRTRLYSARSIVAYNNRKAIKRRK